MQKTYVAALIVCALAIAAVALAFGFRQQALQPVESTYSPQLPAVRGERSLPVFTECQGDAQEECGIDGCGGMRYCFGGKWGVCVRNRKICSPGEIVPCSSATCSIGRRECNKCGDGFGTCNPAAWYNET